MPRYFPFSIKPVDLEINIGNYQISHSKHKKVKHCIEGTFIDKIPSYHIGFTPVRDERVMVSFLRKQNNTYLYQRIDSSTENFYNQIDLTPQENETYLVCLDSENKTITSINGNDKRTATYSDFIKENIWSVFVDGSASTDVNPTHISINIGYTEFKNNIPDGYYPCIYGIEELQGISKKLITLNCKTKIISYTIFYITLINK